MLQELRGTARGETYDEQPMADLDSEVIDFLAASESFKPNRTLRKLDLETLRLLTSGLGSDSKSTCGASSNGSSSG